MEGIAEGVKSMSLGVDTQKKNRIQVSNTKKPLFFYVNLAKRYMQQYTDVELSALGMGVPALAITGLPSVPTDIAARDGRPNKKSKWDKVDGDVKNPPLAAGTNAAPVSGASAGSGYSAFANTSFGNFRFPCSSCLFTEESKYVVLSQPYRQQRRREVEGRKSSERKLERRS
ncbi:hypothetical protein F2Q68_00014663 [Brassica cretica]|uniref:Uncharacterized protein n=1 Tax=Brassica cretica TaxID=69181 RepID=A0A8S9HNS8_BRACR|nr:hypothetical protein F2Q68_00014663 [Brassica cretica]